MSTVKTGIIPDKNKVQALKNRIKFLKEVEQEYLTDNRRTDAAAVGRIIQECLEMIFVLKTGGFIDWQEIPKEE